MKTFFSVSLTIAALAALSISATGVAAAQPAARPDAGYVGVSSQSTGSAFLHRPVSFRVSKTGGTVSRYDIQWAAPCTSKTGRGSYSGLSITRNKVISAQGSFTDTNVFNTDLGQGNKAIFKVVLTGRFVSPKKATGTFRVTVLTVDASNRQTDTCDTGAVTWSALD